MNANASESIEPPLKGEVGGEAARRGRFRYKNKVKKKCSDRTPQSVLRTASSYRAVPFCHFVTFPHSMGNHPFQGSLICQTS